jgi:hypothetical protein
MLSWLERLRPVYRPLLIVFLSMAGALLEPLSEQAGLFSHSEEWSHVYSFIGYLFFLLLLWKFHRWITAAIP